ncbi:DDE_3 domain-containing protein [Trichonephila clavipes]|nr:DDE_3 domain-containing protein [Trichonephila clavipes]
MLIQNLVYGCVALKNPGRLLSVRKKHGLMNRLSFTLSIITRRGLAWMTPAQAYDRHCLFPTVKHGSGSVTIWATVSWFSVGPFVNLKRKVTEEKHREILADQVHPMKQTLFLAGDRNFVNKTCVWVQSWFDRLKNKVKYIFGPAQSLDFSIIKPLWFILERSIRN